MSRPVQQRRLKRSDFNERTAVPNPTASAALLGFFEVRFARKVPGGLVDQEAQFAARHRSTQGALRFSLQTNRITYDANCSNNALASFRSSVSNPSVNQP
jgi:hypothetical protein